MKLLCLAACVAMASAWIPGQRQDCNRVNADGGSILLPHERYCQLYYACDVRGNQTPLWCPQGMLFAYGPGIATCVMQDGITTLSCPNWSCQTVQDVGRRYPDTCCGKYWECTAINTFTSKECSNGFAYDVNQDRCQQGSRCEKNEFCYDDIVPSNNRECHNSPSPSGDPCLYRSEGWEFDRQCPVGTAFDSVTCACTQLSTACSASGLSVELLLKNKEPSANCQASGKMTWDQSLAVFSDKLQRNVDHYFYRTASGFTSNGREGIFAPQGNIVPFIYDYFYNDNTLYSPLAIVMMVRFDQSQLNTVYNLLENRWTTDQSNQHCPPTLIISARYEGVQFGDRSWEFSITAVGENSVQSTGTVKVTGGGQDYYRIVLTFGVTSPTTQGLAGSVTNYGSSGQIASGQQNRFQSDNRNLGSALRPTKCGFAIGRGLSGRISEFSVHEGCSNFNSLSGQGGGGGGGGFGK